MRLSRLHKMLWIKDAGGTPAPQSWRRAEPVFRPCSIRGPWTEEGSRLEQENGTMRIAGRGLFVDGAAAAHSAAYQAQSACEGNSLPSPRLRFALSMRASLTLRVGVRP